MLLKGAMIQFRLSPELHDAIRTHVELITPDGQRPNVSGYITKVLTQDLQHSTLQGTRKKANEKK